MRFLNIPAVLWFCVELAVVIGGIGAIWAAIVLPFALLHH